MSVGSFADTKDPRLSDPDMEAAFQQWYGKHAARLGISLSPDDPAHHYDFRHAYLEGYEPDENGAWDYRASESFAKTAGKKNVMRRNYTAPGTHAAAPLVDEAPAIEPEAPAAPMAIANLSGAQRADAQARLASIEKRLGDYVTAVDSYTKGYISPEEATGYRTLAKSGDEYARQMANHGRAFVRGAALGEQAQSVMEMSFLPAFAQSFVAGIGEAGIGVGRAALLGAAGPYQLNAPAIDAMTRKAREKFDSEVVGLPANPIERAGYDSTFPWVGRLLGDLGAFASVAAATSGMGEAAGIPKLLATARGARGLVAVNALGAIGGAIVAAGTAPDDITAQRVVEGAAVGLGGTALVSTFLAGRPIGIPARLLKIQTMAETLGAEGLGGALKVAPRLVFGRMAMSGIEGAGYTALTAMGRGEPVDKAIGEGVESGLTFAGYDTAFLGLGRMARWLPIHARISETWAKTAEALKIPARMAAGSGDVANAALQAVPGALAGGVLGPLGAMVGGAISAKKALELQTELATTAARLRSTGTLTESTVDKILTGDWKSLSAEEAESVTRALTKDVVERAAVDADPVLRYAIDESMGTATATVLDSTELKANAIARGQMTQAISDMRSRGILEIDPSMIQASRRLAELAERRSQIFLEQMQGIPGRSTHSGVLGRISEKEASAKIREIIETAGSNKGLVLAGDVEAGAAGDRLIASVKAAQGETGRAVRGITEGIPTRISFRTNSTLVRDLADAGLETAGIDAQLSDEAGKVLDRLLIPRKMLTGPAIEAEVVGRWMPSSHPPTPGRAIAPAGTKLLKAPGFVDFGDEFGRASGPALRTLAGGAVGGAAGARFDSDNPTEGAIVGALAGASIAGGTESLLRTAGSMRRDLNEIRANVDRGLATTRAELATDIARGDAVRMRRFSRRAGSTIGRVDIEPSIALAEKQVASLGPANPKARAAFDRAYRGYHEEISKILKRKGLPQSEVDSVLIESPRMAALSDRVAALESKISGANTVAHNAGYIFEPAGEIARTGGRPPIRMWKSNKPMPITGDTGLVTDEMITKNGLVPPPVKLSGEAGAARTGLLGPLAGGGIGAVLAPAIAQRIGLLDEDDSALTASAVGFLIGAGLGYKALAREGIPLNAAANRVAKFVRPTVEGALAPNEAARLIGKTGNDFRVAIGGSQVSGRRLYWMMPPQAQVEHTISNINAWPQRTTMRKGGKTITMDLGERRTQFERDLKRFAPFTVTDNDWGRVTDSFMNATKALGYSPANAMRLYKGWLGWMTTPLEARARVDISKMSLDMLGRDIKNPFTTAAGMTELRDRAVTAHTLTGPSMPLPRNYRRAANSLNKDGTPAAGRIRALVDDIEANVPSRLEGTAETMTPWWSAPGMRGVAPTVRFYRYADRLIASGDPSGQLTRNVTHGIFEATELARVADDKDRALLASIFAGITSTHDMDLVSRAVQSPTVRDAIRGTNPRVYEAAIGIRKFAKDKADTVGLPEQERIEDYLPWVYNYRTKRELAELASKGAVPSDINYPIDAPVPRQVFFNHLESRTADSPLGTLVSPYESLLMYSHGANRKIYMDQLLANFGPETFRNIRATQPWIAHDLGRWLLDVVGVPGPGTMYVQRKVESLGLWLEQFPMFQRPGLAQEINDKYLLAPSGANNISRLATGYAYTSKIAWNTLSMMTNLSQQIINGGTEYGILNVLTSSLIGAGVAGGERVPVLAPVLDAITPRTAEYRKLLLERGILSETSQRHFDAIALYEANFGTNRAHLALTGITAGAAAGAASTALLNTDRSSDDKLSIAGGAVVGATVASFGAAKSAIMRRALLRVRDVGTFGFNLVETWNRATIGVAGIREARAAERAIADPAFAARRRAGEVVEGIFTGALGGAAFGNVVSDAPVAGALLGAATAAGGSRVGESRTARTTRSLEAIRGGAPIFESRIIRDQAKDALRPFTDDEIGTLYAQMQTDITQFRIAKEGRGYFLNTPHGQALGALQSYTLNQAEFVGGRLQSFLDTANRAIKGEPVAVDFRVFRFASYLMAVGSVYGAILGGSRDGESDPDHWISRLGFGVMPLLQFNDVTHRWEIKDPGSLFVGPLIGDIGRVANSYLKLIQDEDANASFADTSDELTRQLFPGAKNIIKSQEAERGKATLRYLQEGAAESMGGMQSPGAPRGR